MDLFNDKNNQNSVSGNETEIVEQEKQEFHLIGEYSRTRGLKLFYYNPMNDTVNEEQIKYGDTIHLVPDGDKLIPVDYEQEQAFVDPRCIHFEALNMDKAKSRVRRWKAGRVNSLCNLKPPKDGVINFW